MARREQWVCGRARWAHRALLQRTGGCGRPVRGNCRAGSAPVLRVGGQQLPGWDGREVSEGRLDQAPPHPGYAPAWPGQGHWHGFRFEESLCLLVSGRTLSTGSGEAEFQLGI